MNSAALILEIAERRMRQVGYNAVSYRDIAAEMGIKSASLHYHFPRKEDLGVALVRQYSEAFQSSLLETTSEAQCPVERIEAFIDLYRRALVDENLVCLCAVLGAEASGIPKPVADEVRSFFKSNSDWLTEQYGALDVGEPNKSAKATLALMEGAMIVSAVNDDLEVFEAAAEMILGSL